MKQRLTTETRRRCAAELQRATLRPRVRLEAKILREVRAALAKQFSRAALYAVAPAK